MSIPEERVASRSLLTCYREVVQRARYRRVELSLHSIGLVL
jgi:hypothetical protein